MKTKFKKFLSNMKLGDITSIYNMSSIKDKYIIDKNNNKIYIFEIMPVVIYEDENFINQIILKYKEFLKQFDYNFQIIIKNKEINLSEYIKEDIEVDLLEEHKEYYLSLDEFLSNNKIYTQKIYFIVSLANDNMDLNKVINKVKKLEDLGCKVSMINSKEKLQNIMYKFLNKE